MGWIKNKAPENDPHCFVHSKPLRSFTWHLHTGLLEHHDLEHVAPKLGKDVSQGVTVHRGQGTTRPAVAPWGGGPGPGESPAGQGRTGQRPVDAAEKDGSDAIQRRFGNYKQHGCG